MSPAVLNARAVMRSASAALLLVMAGCHDDHDGRDLVVSFSPEYPVPGPGFLKASNGGLGDSFGNAVAVSGHAPGKEAAYDGGSQFRVMKGETVIAVSPVDSSGTVYVYRWRGGSWGQEVYLKTDGPGFGANVGSSASISGGAVVVGALDDASPARDGPSPSPTFIVDSGSSVAGASGSPLSPRLGAVHVYSLGALEAGGIKP